jgi:multicomponent Na+:H+ antiporter subunit B
VNAVLLVDLILLVLVIAVGIAIVQTRNLFTATMLGSVYSLLMALVWSNMHALDVGFTEAAVGAGASTVLLLGALVATGRFERLRPSLDWNAVLVCAVTGAALVYGTLDMPHFGDPDAPVQTRRVPGYLTQDIGKLHDAPLQVGGHHEVDPEHPHPADDFDGHVPNTVTSLLAAYRGYDTMFETCVIFTAGASLILMLRRRRDEDDVVPARDAKADPRPHREGSRA